MTVTRDQALRALRERIVAYAASRMGRDTAEDLAQEVLLLLEQKYKGLERIEDLLPLSFRILRFKMHGYRRTAVRRGEDRAVQAEEASLVDGGDSPFELARRNELEERLAAALGKLDGRCREMFRLKLEGRNFEEIGKTLGAATMSTVYTWDHRCRKRLLDLMGGSWEAAS